MRLDDPVDFGRRLRAERESLGLAVHELAHICSVTDGMQRKLEAGTLKITIDYLQALGCRTDADVLSLIAIE